MKKIVLTIIISSLIFSSSGIFSRPAKAVWGVGDIVSDPWHTIVNVVGWVKDVALKYKDQLLDTLRDAIVKRIVDMMTDQVVQWIQGGGEPKFVTDWQGFLNDAFQAGVGDVISESNLKFLCSPFGFQLRIALLPVPTFSKRITCTLDDIITNINDFYNDFRNGGWIAYEQSWQPQNNYYGALYMTMNEAMIQGAKAKEAAQNEASAGKGFLSVKKCVQWALNANDRLQKGEIKNLDQACIKWTIVTPGDTVGEAVAKAMGAQTDWIVNVKSIVSAIVNAAINRLMTEGLSLMKGSQSQNVNNNIAPPEYQGIVTQELISQKQFMIDEYQKFLDAVQPILNSKKQSLFNAQTLVSVFSSLKSRNCQPPVSDIDITNTQSDANRLQIEVNDLQKIVDELNTNINQIKNISEDNRDREMSLAVDNYRRSIDKYSYLYEEITTGSMKQAAQDEANAFQSKASSAQVRLNTCLPPTATSTTP